MELKINATTLQKALKKAGHKMYTADSQDYNLNIVGIRSASPTPNLFEDLLVVAWKFNGKWTIKQYPITTLAGLKYLEKPMNPKGCAILKEGRYEKTWKIELHNQQYEALCQRRPVDIYRDNNKNAEYDMVAESETNGIFGINIHRASKYNVLYEVNGNSAGCQVFQDPKHFEEFMLICKASKQNWGEWFTYTLINETHFA